jgi:DNA-directed RNA polymerase specialized sigma subunit
MSLAVDQALDRNQGLVESLAAKISASPGAKRVGAEYEDLVQEGMIAVWQSTERGNTLDIQSVVSNRMRDWVKFLAHRGANSYAEFLPLDDFRELVRAD